MDATRASSLFHRSPPAVVVREYGRDSVLVWANLFIAPLLASLGLRVGLRSASAVVARMEADAAAMRRKGYLVASVQTFTLPGLMGRETGAQWHRVTFERSPTGPGDDTAGDPGPRA